MHGGVPKTELGIENLAALKEGLPNLLKHVENLTIKFGLPVVVAVNRFPGDTEAELKLIEDECQKLGVNVALSEVWAKGSAGGMELAREVVRLAEGENRFRFVYEDQLDLKAKIETVVREIYGGDGVAFTPAATKAIANLEDLEFGNLPICMAKTQYSLSDDPQKLGAPRGFQVTVRNVKVSAGAGFVVVYTGEILTMPGLPKVPAAERIDVDSQGKITGLF
jgi:formate--tetrahydrofolate ligase